MNRRQFSVFFLKLGFLPLINFFLSPPSLAKKDRGLKIPDNFLNVMDYGCEKHVPGSDYYFDNRVILQKLLDYIHEKNSANFKTYTLYFPHGDFFLSSTSVVHNKGLPGAFCLQLYSNINIVGEGTLKLLPGQYGQGSFFRMLASDRFNKICNVILSGINIDGNRAHQVQGIQSSNILLECESNITIDGVTSINANGNGILVRGGVDINKAVKKIAIANCTVTNCSKIGIQVSQFNDLSIYSNKISNCGDNGIDLYGDVGRNDLHLTNGNEFKIFENYVKDCLNGIFPETVSNGEIYNNKVHGMKQSGIHINRINGEPKNINIYRNSIGNSTIGFSITGDMKNIIIKKNYMHSIKSCFFSFGSSKGAVSGITVIKNQLLVDRKMKSIISFSGLRANNITFISNLIKKEEYANTKLIENNAEVFIKNTVK